MVGDYPSRNASKNALKAMVHSAATATLGEPSDSQSGGNPGSFHRSAYLAPPLTHSGAPGALADASAILIELGQSGGPQPHRARPVQSLVSRQLAAADFDIAAWDDLTVFEVACLHPGRTLIEKLLRINNFASDPTAQESLHGWPRIGRQFYDVWALLGTDEVVEFFADRPLVSEILASCYEVSVAFIPDQPVPVGGFARVLAFDPGGPLADRLRAEHDGAMRDLYYGTEPPPSFDDVIARVQEHSDALDIG